MKYVFIMNNLANEGGAMYMISNSNIEIYDSVFKNNESKAKAGALYITE